ncbi:MAG: hypothetical protein M1834_007250 [Cirrosporium novae-zelandiae]|nr:MAG: hypothetical protein M1834_007250 [Cirrosporium novae-zelandiae]
MPSFGLGGLSGDSRDSDDIKSSPGQESIPLQQDYYDSNEKSAPHQTIFASPTSRSSWRVDTSTLEAPHLPGYPYARQFKHSKQRIHLLLHGMFQWFITFAFCASIAGCLEGYAARQIFDTKAKHIFNAVITGLSICLGINMGSAFKSMAHNARWWILSRQTYSPLEFDMILSCESLTTLCQLMWVSRKTWRWITIGCCVAWISVNMAMQVGVALIGLTYNINDDDNWVLVRSGLTSAADSSHFYPYTIRPGTSKLYGFKRDIPTLSEEQNTANLYGTQLAYMYDDSKTPVFAADNEELSWGYCFRQINAISATEYFSSRCIVASTYCTAYEILDGAAGNSSIVTYLNGDTRQTLNVTTDHAEGGTTYITDTATTCGPRCANVMVFQSMPSNPTANSAAAVYNCNSYVGELGWTDPYEAPREKQKIKDQQAKVAAGAIGSTGVVADNSTLQYKLYLESDFFGTNYFGNNISAAQYIAFFTIGAIAQMDSQNPTFNITDGEQPYTGMMLQVEWPYVWGILGALLGAQFLLMVLGIWLADGVIVRDDSFLSMARLLGPLVEHLTKQDGEWEGGCLLDSDEIAKSCERVGINQVTYTAYMTKADGSLHHVGVEREVGLKGRWPKGWYDGGRRDQGRLNKRI